VLNDVFNYARYYLLLAMSRPMFFLMPALLTFSAGAYYIMSLKPSYYSEAFLLLELQQMPSSLISPTVSNDRLQFIEERVFTKDKLIALAQDFDLFPEARAKMSRGLLAAAVRNKIVLRSSMNEGTGGPASSASIWIGFNDGDAKLAADITNKLIEMIVVENRRMRTSRATEATKFFTHEVDNIKAHMQAREAEWQAFREANKLVQPARIPALLIELQAKEQELVTVNQARLVLDEEVKLMEGQLRLGEGESSEAATMRTQLAALQTEITEKSLVYSDTHPRIRILKQRLDELNARAAKVLTKPANPEARTLSPELALLGERIANAKPRQEASLALSTQLSARIDWLKAVIARAPEVEVRLEAIEAEKLAIQRSLTEMQGKLDTARLGERLELDNSFSKIEVVEAPEVASQRTGPARKLIALVVAGMSLLAGALGILVADALDRTIRGSFDLAKALEGQELIMIPNWTPQVEARRWLGWWSDRGGMSPTKL
jgi:uncharacterized protein involved in exopolysaccharide biosynthesis